jgi:hypothetical protein
MSSYSDLAKRLHSKCEEFSVHLKTLQTVNSGLQSSCEKALTALQALVGSPPLAPKIVCSTCCTRERTHCLLPCGHAAYCEGCATRAERRGRCFTCRGPVEGKLRVYI